jgi:hypothetical protein
MEGIDRRTMSAPAQVVYTEASGGSTLVLTSAGAVSNNTANYVVVPGGGPDMEIGPLTFTIDSQIIVHATLYFEGTAAAVPEPIYLIMQVSTNGGGAWTDMVGTAQVYATRDFSGAGFTTVGATACPPACTSASWSTWFSATAGQSLNFRIGYKTTLGPVTFLNGTMFTETFPNS